MSSEPAAAAPARGTTATWSGEVPVERSGRARLWWEVAIVLGLSLGQSAVYSIVSIVDRSTQSTPLADQTAQVNPSQSSRQVFDFLYQFLGNAFPLFAVALVIFLLWQPGRSGFRRIGFDLSRPGRDLGGECCSSWPSASPASSSTRSAGCSG